MINNDLLNDLRKALFLQDEKSARNIVALCKQDPKMAQEIGALLVQEESPYNLMHSYTRGEIPIVRILLQVPGLNFNKLQYKDGWTLLQEVSQRGDREMTEFLLRNCDAAYINKVSGPTAFNQAIWNRRVDVALSFMQNAKVDVNLPDQYGNTPLACAILIGEPEIVRQLLRHPGINLKKKVYNEGYYQIAFYRQRDNKESKEFKEILEYLEDMGLGKTVPDQDVLAEKCLLYLEKLQEGGKRKQQEIEGQQQKEAQQQKALGGEVKQKEKRGEVKQKEKRGDVKENEPGDEDVYFYSDDMDDLYYQLNRGQCSGLTALWLWSKGGSERANFFAEQRLIAAWDPEKDPLWDERGRPTFIEKHLKHFISTMVWAQGKHSLLMHPKKKRRLQQTDFRDFLEVIQATKTEPKVQNEFALTFILSSDAFLNLLKNVVLDNKKVWLGGPHHAVGIIKEGNQYCVYDTIQPAGEFYFDTPEALHEFLLVRLFKSFDFPVENLEISVRAFDIKPERKADEEVRPYPYKLTELQFIEATISDEPAFDVNRKSFNGNTSMMLAADEGLTEVVRLLLKKPGIDINIKDDKGSSALMNASKMGHLGVVELLAHRKEVNIRDIWSSMMLAYCYGYEHIAAILNDILSNKRSKELTELGFSMKDPVVQHMIKVCQGSSSSVSEFVEADVNWPDPNGMTMLMWATQRYDAEMIDTILEKFPKIPLNVRNHRGETVLMMAAEEPFDNVYCMESLIQDNEIDPKLALEALLVAAQDDKTEIMDFISDAAKIDLEDPWVVTMLGAAQNGSAMDPRVINQQDHQGNTALMLAVKNHSYFFMKILFGFSDWVDFNVTNAAGKTALQIAEENQDKESARLIREMVKQKEASQKERKGNEPGKELIFSEPVEPGKKPEKPTAATPQKPPEGPPPGPASPST